MTAGRKQCVLHLLEALNLLHSQVHTCASTTASQWKPTIADSPAVRCMHATDLEQMLLEGAIKLR